MKNDIINEDINKLLREYKKKFFTSDNLYNDILNIKSISKIIGADSSKLDLKFLKNMYDYKKDCKKYRKEYMDVMYFIKDNFHYINSCGYSYVKMLDSINFISLNNFNGQKTYNFKFTKEILYDFFAYMGVNEYKFFCSLINENRILFTKELEEENVYGLYYSFEHIKNIHYLAIKKDNKITIPIITTIVHEVAHAIEKNNVVNRTSKYSAKESLTQEIISYFYELEFLRYLEKNNFNYFETIPLINNFYEQTKLWSQDFEYYFRDMIMEKDIDCISRIANDMDFDTDQLSPVIGYYAALHFSQLKEQNPKEFKKNFDNFVAMRTLMEYKEMIESMGMTLEEYKSANLIKTRIIDDQTKFKRIYKIDL